MDFNLALGLYGVLAAFIFLILHYEWEAPLTICLLLTVPSVVVGAGIAAAATYILPINFFHSSMGLGGLLFVVTSVYSVGSNV